LRGKLIETVVETLLMGPHSTIDESHNKHHTTSIIHPRSHQYVHPQQVFRNTG